MSLAKLSKIPGLGNFHFLDRKDIIKIKELEEARNTGVFDVLEKNNVLMMTHTSEFRPPSAPIVVNNEFPAIKFPEIEGAISSSPGIKVHNYLIERFSLVLTDEATLIVGWN